MQENQYSALNLKAVNQLKQKAQRITDELGMSEQEQKIWSLIQEVRLESDKILSCDLPTDQEDNVVLVQIVHSYVDVIFAHKRTDEILKKLQEQGFEPDNASLLQKIQKIAEISFKFKAGNCQEKSFYGFSALLKKLIDKKIVNYEASISLELAYFDNHFIMIVDNKFLFDPWLSISFKIPPRNNSKEFICNFFKDFGDLITFFQLREDWNCYEAQCEGMPLQFDAPSSYYTTMLFPPPQIMNELLNETITHTDECESTGKMLHQLSTATKVQHKANNNITKESTPQHQVLPKEKCTNESLSSPVPSNKHKPDALKDQKRYSIRYSPY